MKNKKQNPQRALTMIGKTNITSFATIRQEVNSDKIYFGKFSFLTVDQKK